MKKVRIIQISNGTRRQLELSSKRARELGLCSSTSLPVTVAYIMEGAFAWDGSESDQTETCPRCGTTFREVVLYHRVGCADCFSVFSKSIDRIIANRSEGSPYGGRIPSRLERFRRLFVDREDLRLQLADALSEEDFESAATFRDRLEKLESEPDD